MGRTRILILDDNVSWRRTLTRSLETATGLEILGAVGLGELGLEKVRQIAPEAVLLSASSPGAERSTTNMLDSLKTHFPQLPVVVASTLDERGSPHALEYLTHGAASFVPLGASSELAEERREALRKVLLEPINARKQKHDSANPPETSAVVETSPPPRSKTVAAVAIGVSTGGPDVLARLLPALPARFPVPVFVVQHILPEFTRSLIERLEKACPNPVREAAEGDVPAPGTIWIAPGEKHLEVVRVDGKPRLRLSSAPPENLCRPAADVLFRTAARTYGGGLIAVVLTGMGSDGMRGCREIREHGGSVLVQDKASSIVWGMPGAVAEAGLADEILPPDQIVAQLIKRTRAVS
ncbi:MAG: chemotaxis protein CheB [Isosphaeraceae bacterium]|nr:chemotaxis protein CheB [Isosphaeraceae bacterium]